MTNLSVDLNHLDSAQHAWNYCSQDIDAARRKSSEMKTADQQATWGIFKDAWAAHITAAGYFYDRLSEGVTETATMSSLLTHILNTYAAQDADWANRITKLDGGQQ